MSRSTIGRATMNTGAGNDEAVATNLKLHQASRFNLGGGEDLAWVGTDTSVIDSDNLTLAGGGGNDLYHRHFAEEAVFQAFEGEGVEIDTLSYVVDFNNQVIDAQLDLSIT